MLWGQKLCHNIKNFHTYLKCQIRFLFEFVLRIFWHQFVMCRSRVINDYVFHNFGDLDFFQCYAIPISSFVIIILILLNVFYDHFSARSLLAKLGRVTISPHKTKFVWYSAAGTQITDHDKQTNTSITTTSLCQIKNAKMGETDL